MKTSLLKPLVCLASGLVLAACTHSPDAADKNDNDAMTNTSPVSLSYPDTRRLDHKDSYHGVEVADPYRWLEQQGSDEVKQWVEQQNQLSLPYLKALPTRDKYQERLTALWDFEKYRAPFSVNGTLFYSHNDGLQNQYVLWMKPDDSAPAQVLINPNAFSEDGTVSMGSFEVSPKAAYVAYTKSDGGSDWKSIHVKRVSDTKDLGEVIEGVKFTNIAWMPDESGFFYSRYPKNAAGEWDDSQPVAVYFHRLGTPQGSDKHVVAFADKPTWNPYANVIDDGNTLLITIFERYSENAIYTLPVSEGLSDSAKKNVTPLFNKWDGLYEYVSEKDGDIYFTTTANAPTGKVIKTTLATGQVTTVVPAKKETLRSVSLFGDTLIANYLKDVKSMVNVYALDGSQLRQVKLDSIGNVKGFKGSKDSQYAYYKLTSFTNPGAVYRYDVASGESSLYKAISTGVDYSQYQVKQVFYTSKDGTEVPMFIIHKKDVALDGHNKTLLYGYGGFNVSLTPSYSVSRMVWLEQGNVLAIANLRGGGEYGQQWHKAGTKMNKQNVFDDFIAAAEYLIDSGYTQSKHLAVQGGSNGGLLVGAVLTQRPDLFAAALPAVGVLDMLRYHTPSANARGWSSDYGLSENQDEFEALYAYSPLHNTQQGVCYPATLVTTGDHDDRVVPWHSYKFAAQLQAHQGCDNPVLLRVETRAGHGAGTPTWMRIEGYADQWAFLEAALK